jgi:hypothetical protein
MQVLDSFLDAMGNTPLVKLTRVTAGVKPTILAKLEMLNPASTRSPISSPPERCRPNSPPLRKGS